MSVRCINMNFCSAQEFFKTEQQNVRAILLQNYSIEHHVHDFYEINVVLKGCGNHILGDREISTSEGDVFVIPPFVSHSYRQTKNLNVFHLLLRQNFLQNAPERSRVAGLDLLLEIEPFLRQNASNHLFLRLSQSQLLSLHDELYALLPGGTLDYPGAEPVQNQAALKLLYYMAHLLSTQTIKSNTLPNEKEAAILAAIQYMREHYKESICIDDLCKACFVSRSTFMRGFKILCGCTPFQYLREYRIKMATEMLLTAKSKSFVAQECGFYDLAHMQKVLKNR